METIETVDKYTPIYGDKVDSLPLYLKDRHNGHRFKLSYKEEVIDSTNPQPTVTVKAG